MLGIKRFRGRPKVSATAAGSPVPLSLRDVLKIPGFKRLWLAQLVSILGDFLAVFGVINLITFKWHGTPLQVTNVMIAFIIPMAIVGPLAGVFVDRWNAKRTMIIGDLIRAALLRTLVPVNGLMSANALMSQAFYTMRIIAPAAAGLLVYWLGYNSCFYLDSASFFFSAAMLSTIAIVRMNAKDATEKTVGSLSKDYTAGSRFILTHPAISFVMIAMMTAMFVLSCFSPLISVYVRDQLHAGTRAFGIISAMVGVGLILGTQVVNADQRVLEEIRGVERIVWPVVRDVCAGAVSDAVARWREHVRNRLCDRLHCCSGADTDAAGDSA